MPSASKILGILRPLGGGDPVPFTKESLVVGRRSTCDVCLDFENVSGRHCEFKMVDGVWNLKDLGSSNGTTINGEKITGPVGVMPDVEIGIATHLFRLDYEPSEYADSGSAKNVVEDAPKRSLMEMAGLESDDRPRRRPSQPPAKIERLSAQESAFDDPVPDHVQKPPPKKVASQTDDDFFDLIKDDVK